MFNNKIDTDGMPSHLRDLLVRLNFIGMIEKGYKPCFHDLSFVPAASWWGTMKRSWSSESGKLSIEKIESTIDEGIRSLKTFSGSEFYPIVRSAIINSKKGIENIIETYKSVPSIVAHLQIVLETIRINKELSDIKCDIPLLSDEA